MDSTHDATVYVEIQGGKMQMRHCTESDSLAHIRVHVHVWMYSNQSCVPISCVRRSSHHYQYTGPYEGQFVLMLIIYAHTSL